MIWGYIWGKISNKCKIWPVFIKEYQGVYLSKGPLQGMFSDFVHCLCFCGVYTDQNQNIHIKGCMEIVLRWLSLNLVVEWWPVKPKDDIIAKLSPAQSNSSSVGWAEIVLISTLPPCLAIIWQFWPYLSHFKSNYNGVKSKGSLLR